MKVPEIYDVSAYQMWLTALQMLEGDAEIDAHYDMGFFAVLHQLGKILLIQNGRVRLRDYVSRIIGAPEIQLHARHTPFENYSLEVRHVLIQMAMWLLADPDVRIVDAWRNKAVRYNVLKKDFQMMPAWYQGVVGQCSDWRRI